MCLLMQKLSGLTVQVTHKCVNLHNSPHEGGSLIPPLHRHFMGPAAFLPAWFPLCLPLSFPSWPMAPPFLQLLKLKTLLLFSTIPPLLHPMLHPSGNPVDSTSKTHPESDHFFTLPLQPAQSKPQASLACIIGKSANGLSYLLSLSISFCYHPSSQEDLVKPHARELQVKMKVLVAQSCPTPCDPMDFSLPGFSVQGILQARILGWVATSFSRGYSQPRDRTRFFTV